MLPCGFILIFLCKYFQQRSQNEYVTVHYTHYLVSLLIFCPIKKRAQWPGKKTRGSGSLWQLHRNWVLLPFKPKGSHRSRLGWGWLRVWCLGLRKAETVFCLFPPPFLFNIQRHKIVCWLRKKKKHQGTCVFFFLGMLIILFDQVTFLLFPCFLNRSWVTQLNI